MFLQSRHQVRGGGRLRILQLHPCARRFPDRGRHPGNDLLANYVRLLNLFLPVDRVQFSSLIEIFAVEAFGSSLSGFRIDRLDV